MKKSTLLFRSFGIIILLAGFAHLFTYASNNKNVEILETNSSIEDLNSADELNNETDYIIGNWKVSYNGPDYKGSVVYQIKKEGKVFNAYTHEYQDENGFSEKAKGEKHLVIQSFDGYKGKGIYMIDYEGEKYNIDCVIDMVDENTFKLSYDYYGYSDTETWKRN